MRGHSPAPSHGNSSCSQATRNNPTSTPGCATLTLPLVHLPPPTVVQIPHSAASAAHGITPSPALVGISPGTSFNGDYPPLICAPQIEVCLSTYKVFKHKKFQVTIKIDTCMKQRLCLSSDDILIAGLNAKCCRENSNEEVENCKICCVNKKVITVGIQSAFHSTSAINRNTRNPMEIYVFDDCKSNCSSSRDHLRSSLTLVVELHPGTTVRSSPFVLQARATQSRLHKQKPPSQLITETSISPVSIPSPLDNATPRYATSLLEINRSLPPSRTSPSPPTTSTSPSLSSSLPEKRSITHSSGIPMNKRYVFLHFLQHDGNSPNIESTALPSLTRTVPGFIHFESRTLPAAVNQDSGMVVLFHFFNTHQNATMALQVTNTYLETHHHPVKGVVQSW